MEMLTLAAALFLFPAVAAGAGQNAEQSGAMLPTAFNGHDLTGWEVPDGNIWWTARDGVLSARSGPNKKGSTLWTERKYRDFVMQLEFRMGEGTVDSGVFIRNEREQIQIGISGSLKRDMTGSPYIAGKGYPAEAKGVKKLLRHDEWNARTVVAIGNHYSVWLNGVHVLGYNSDTAAEEGPVGLQLHPSNEMAIDFRKITLGKLD